MAVAASEGVISPLPSPQIPLPTWERDGEMLGVPSPKLGDGLGDEGRQR